MHTHDTGHDAQPLEVSKHKAVASGAAATGALAIGATALSGLAVGAIAVGAAAIGALAIGKLKVKTAKLDRVEIGELAITTLTIAGATTAQLRAAPGQGDALAARLQGRHAPFGPVLRAAGDPDLFLVQAGDTDEAAFAAALEMLRDAAPAIEIFRTLGPQR